MGLRPTGNPSEIVMHGLPPPYWGMHVHTLRFGGKAISSETNKTNLINQASLEWAVLQITHKISHSEM